MRNSNFNISELQLKRKFKHARDFEVEGHYNSENSVKFKTAIIAHLENDGIKIIFGAFRCREVIHYFDPSTCLNVVMTYEGDFLTCWRLNPYQVRVLMDSGKLGGG